MEVYGATTQSKNQSNKPTVDFDALNKYVVETCQLQQPETMLGVISVMVDLGTQKQPDAQYKLDDEDKGLTVEQLEEKYKADFVHNFEPKDQNFKITKFANAYDNDSKSWQIMKFVKQPDRQSVVYAVDFPDILLDKGKFFGETEPNPKPLRLWIGGQYWNKYLGEKGMMLVQNVIPLKVTNIGDEGGAKVWSMNPKSSLHKMAVASKIVNVGEAFLPQDVDKLLGKTLQFKAQVCFNKGKDGKEYYTEKLTFAAGLARGQSEKQVENTYLIQFNQENDPQALKELRKHVVNTIENATNYVNQETGEPSAIKRQLDALRSGNTQTSEAPKQDVKEQPKQQPKPTSVPEEDDSEGLPF